MAGRCVRVNCFIGYYFSHRRVKLSPVLLFVMLCLATYRITRFITDDTWPPIQKFREWVIVRTGPDSGWSDLVMCSWCVGVYVTTGVVALVQNYLIVLPVHWFLWGVAIAGAVGLIGENLDG